MCVASGRGDASARRCGLVGSKDCEANARASNARAKGESSPPTEVPQPCLEASQAGSDPMKWENRLGHKPAPLSEGGWGVVAYKPLFNICYVTPSHR